MNQILVMLPMILAAMEGQEKAFIIAQGTKYLTYENTRLGNPLTPQQVTDTITNIAILICAEETLAANKIAGTK